MASCPICNKGTVKKGESMVYCSERVVEKVASGFVDKGCTFKIYYDQKKVFGEVLNPSDIKTMLEGGTITSKKGHKMTLDTDNKDFFTHIEFAQKDDEDL